MSSWFNQSAQTKKKQKKARSYNKHQGVGYGLNKWWGSRTSTDDLVERRKGKKGAHADTVEHNLFDEGDDSHRASESPEESRNSDYDFYGNPLRASSDPRIASSPPLAPARVSSPHRAPSPARVSSPHRVASARSSSSSRKAPSSARSSSSHKSNATRKMRPCGKNNERVDGKCRPKCSSGRERNAKGRCVLKCRADLYNTKTKKCLKECKAGLHRVKEGEGRCVKM